MPFRRRPMFATRRWVNGVVREKTLRSAIEHAFIIIMRERT
jgi:hypothetical protein